MVKRQKSEKYVYSWYTAEGSRPCNPYYESSLARARKSARLMAKGNCLLGSWARWYVDYRDAEDKISPDPIIYGQVEK
jgi:hypothetical protein